MQPNELAGAAVHMLDTVWEVGMHARAAFVLQTVAEACWHHDAGLDVLHAAQDSFCQRRIDLPNLPARSLAFLGQSLLVVGGWGCQLHLFEQTRGRLSWQQRSWKAGDCAEWAIASSNACRLACMQHGVSASCAACRLLERASFWFLRSVF